MGALSEIVDGRQVEPWRVEPVTVFGGWRLMRTRWVRDSREGWELWTAPWPLDSTVYATVEVARAALAALLEPG